MADHAKMNSRDPEPSDPYIGCPECRENVFLSTLTNRETTLNYPLQQLIDIMMKREDGNGGMIINKPKMVTASTSYHKADFQEEQRAMEKRTKEELIAEVNKEMDGFERAMSGGNNIVYDAFLDIEKIRVDHLIRVRKQEEAAAKAKAEKKYGGKTHLDATDFPLMPQAAPAGTTMMLDPAIVSYSMFHMRPPPMFSDYMRCPAVPVQL